MQLLSYKGAVRAPGWAPVKLHCTMPEMVVHGAGKFVRPGALAAGLDLKMYDVGNLYLATQGFAAPTVAGELYVSYVIDFMTPQADIVPTYSNVSARIVADGVNVASIFGNAAVVTGGIGVTAVGSTLTFADRGEYLVALRLTGLELTQVRPVLTGTATTKCVGGDQSIRTASAYDMTSLAYFQVQCNAPGMTVIIDALGSAGTVTNSLVRIGLYSYAL